MSPQRRGSGPRLPADARHALAVRGSGAARPPRRHPLPTGGGRPALLRFPAGQADRPRRRSGAGDRHPARRARGPRRGGRGDQPHAADQHPRPSGLPRRPGDNRLAGARYPMSRRIEFVDTTTRDGNQSLWSATGLTTPDVLAIAHALDRVGYHAADFTSSTHMAVSVRFHREDPWERIRLVSAAMPNTPLSLITPGMRFISWAPAGQDVMDLAFRLLARNGIRRIQIADPSNDPARIRRLAAMVRAAGGEEG